MNEDDPEFFALGLLEMLGEMEIFNGSQPRKPKRIRKWENRDSKDPETKSIVDAHRQRILSLQALSTKKPFPLCPKCGSKLILEREVLDEYRLVCFSARHSIEVTKKVGSIFWVPAYFFNTE